MTNFAESQLYLIVPNDGPYIYDIHMERRGNGVMNKFVTCLQNRSIFYFADGGRHEWMIPKYSTIDSSAKIKDDLSFKSIFIDSAANKKLFNESILKLLLQLL